MKKTLSSRIELDVQVRSCIFFILVGLTLCVQSESIADPAVSSGQFIDSHGAPHSWHINLQHTLVWGGRPWMPAGGVFQSRYLTGPATEANWTADVASLTILKQHGIHSLILVTSNELDPITDLLPEDLQKFLDYLDDQGFQYGISLSSFPRDPVEATIVNPALYRVQSPAPGSTSTFRNIQAIAGAKYYLVSTADGSILTSGDAQILDTQTASVTLSGNQGGLGTVLLLYPKRLFLPDSIEGEHLPDIWRHADDYRDDLLLYFSRIKFGPGLRFFLDPVVKGLGYYGEADGGAIPDGNSYRLEFQLWLENRYNRSLAKLNESWGVKNQDIFDFAAAARSLPMWYQSKGLQLLADPVSNKVFDVMAQQSNYWTDVRAFRLDSQRSVMNHLAVSLKRGVADVPVIYRWTRPSKAYVDFDSNDGYDGLLVSSGEHGDALTMNAGGWALAATEESARTEWLVGEIEPLLGGSSPGYVSKSVFDEDTAALQTIGIKGYFLDSLLALPESENQNTSLLDAPSEQLDWLGADQTAFTIDAGDIAEFLPQILFYPLSLQMPTASIRQFPDATWWLPSYDDGTKVNIGRGLNCYSMKEPNFGTASVLWSPDGTVASAQFALPKSAVVRASTPAGKVVTLLLKKGTYTCPTSKTPIVIQGVPKLPMVANAPIQEMAEVTRLIAEGRGEGIPLDEFEQRLYYIQNEVYKDGSAQQAEDAYPMLVDLNNDLENALSPYAWVEGENASSQSFGAIVASPSAADGAYLWQDTDHGPEADVAPYEATYTLNVGAPGDYTVWASLAPGAPGVGATSPLSFSLDSGTLFDVTQPEAAGSKYGTVLDAGTATRTGSFCWYRLGTISLTPGQHSLNFIETGPAPATGRYTLGIDAICLARGSFVPNGPVRPEIN